MVSWGRAGTPDAAMTSRNGLELLETTLGDRRKQLIAVAKMPVGGGGADAGHPRGVGKGETGRALFGDQPERRLQQQHADQRGHGVGVHAAGALG